MLLILCRWSAQALFQDLKPICDFTGHDNKQNLDRLHLMKALLLGYSPNSEKRTESFTQTVVIVSDSVR